jgi:hypothetical protein
MRRCTNRAPAALVAGMETEMQTSTLTTEQFAALQQFAAAQGRRWKSELRHAWETGDYPSDCDSASLQQVRNTFGPSWLVRFQLPQAGAVPTAQKWGFDFYFGSGSSRTDIRSGCVGADTRDEAEQMVRKACPDEARDYRLSLAIYSGGKQTWPRIVS